MALSFATFFVAVIPEMPTSFCIWEISLGYLIWKVTIRNKPTCSNLF